MNIFITEKEICYLYCSPVVQFGTPGPFHLSHIVLKPTYKYCLTFKCLTTHLQYIDLQYSSRHVFCFCLYSRYLQMCSAIVAELSIHPLNSQKWGTSFSCWPRLFLPYYYDGVNQFLISYSCVYFSISTSNTCLTNLNIVQVSISENTLQIQPCRFKISF